MTGQNLTPTKAANRLTRILENFNSTHHLDRFPINVKELALECGNLFGWDSHITEIKNADIKGFEGCLFSNENKKQWKLLYNHTLSAGRIRFTLAHELGHFLLHRNKKNSFQCSDMDMLNWSDEEKNIESQADVFASYLLMPLDDYREQVTTTIDLDLFSHCADRYGVSLTAAILKWLDYTDQKAVLVMSNDGFMKWAWSSKSAFKAGAYFKTRNNVIPLPDNSLAANSAIKIHRKGTAIRASIWFKNAEPIADIREMKIYTKQYDMVLTLLILPKIADVWPRREYDY
jgi:Zn-dependent peptidase ImmA (M78 family)